MIFKILNIEKETYKEKCIDLTSYCFKACKREDLENRWDSMPREEGTIVGILDDDKLASSMTITNRNIYLYGKNVSMGGIGEVATAAPYRSAGVCSKLMRSALEYMNDQGMVFSMLAPFSYEFYQKFGYKWCFNFKKYTIPVDALRGFETKGTFELLNPKNFNEVKGLYEKIMCEYNGCSVRDNFTWKRIQDVSGDKYVVIYRNQENKACGYMLYSITDKLILDIEELVYENIEVLRAFLNYAYMHNAQANYVTITALEDMPILDVLASPRVECKIESAMMGRIINVQKALSYYPFKKIGQFTMEVMDEKAPWNNNTYTIKIRENGENEIQVIEGKGDVKIHIRELSQLILGFRTLKELSILGKAEVERSRVLEFFEEQRKITGLYDYF